MRSHRTQLAVLATAALLVACFIWYKWEERQIEAKRLAIEREIRAVEQALQGDSRFVDLHVGTWYGKVTVLGGVNTSSDLDKIGNVLRTAGFKNVEVNVHVGKTAEERMRDNQKRSR
jgi:hypothetical protein